MNKNKIYISGVLNFETSLRVDSFPLNYYPINYPFFDINTSIAGTAYDIALAEKTLGNDVIIAGIVGKDNIGNLILDDLVKNHFETNRIRKAINDTPTSIVMYDLYGRRQVQMDLKNIQEQELNFEKEKEAMKQCDALVLTNTNFNRPLLKPAKELGKKIITDVNIIGEIEEPFNKDFMEVADVLFLSNDGIMTNYESFLISLYNKYHNEIIVLGEGTQGAMILDAKKHIIYHVDAVYTRPRFNTYGSGDALLSCFTHYYLKGVDSLECLKLAITFASYKIGERGSSKGFLTHRKLKKFYDTIDYHVYEIARF